MSNPEENHDAVVEKDNKETKPVKKVKKVKKTTKKAGLPDFSAIKVKQKPSEKKSSKTESESLYTYDQMLDMIYKKCNVTQSTSKQEIELPRILVVRDGSKRVIWQNFSDICKRLHRLPEDVKLFVLEELQTMGSIDSKGGFTIKGNLNPTHLETIVYQYVAQFVQCPVCKSLQH
ncbi:eukaryotic translation initiation factor 2 subunit, putative [Entamoeba invadens IP1]|uniref:Eukaryotic translation initiation factor 2 subunit, putative n=1 Tax=Entamoeba invadens IP1 TaxID=370355 RepID=A0A0A1U9N2_ENTIV|nr:eukaryotic translation initiation factor 2 subunit, putative [Entamoeba invadens IP1]ELP88825.1 eukaryotic translation initiation factor 2 subunit, putative [Entamoeba invadens IP1]|eukprot:XP_004255596.1 eukaryotic translation initiation factor 2 subunit, putative [Entamoeba invadens IP1]